MVDQPLHEKIEAYLLGQLPTEEAAAFRKQVESDPQLAEEVELHRLILPVPDRLAEIDLHEDFAKWRQELEDETDLEFRHSIQRLDRVRASKTKGIGQETSKAKPESLPPSPPAKPRNQLLILLVLALLISVGAFLLWRHMDGRVAEERAERLRAEQALQNARMENEQLKQENSQLQGKLLEAPQPAAPAPKASAPKTEVKEPIAAAPEPDYLQWADEELIAYADDMLETFRTRSARSNLPGETLIEKADTAIQRRQFKQATTLLRSVKPDDPMYAKSLEILAFVHFKRKQYADAVNTYKKYRNYNLDTDKTDWDLCLFYLADYPRYKNELNNLLGGILSDPKHPKFKDAVRLLEKLKVPDR